MWARTSIDIMYNRLEQPTAFRFLTICSKYCRCHVFFISVLLRLEEKQNDLDPVKDSEHPEKGY